jgi:hypothetical protein
VAIRLADDFVGSSLSRRNFARTGYGESSASKSRRVLRKAVATTRSDGQACGRIVRTHDPKETHTRCGTVVARAIMIPCAMSPSWMNRWYASGFDRLMMILLGEISIRDVIPLFKTRTGACLIAAPLPRSPMASSKS